MNAASCGTKHLKDVELAATLGIVVDLAVRVLLFLAVLGVVSKVDAESKIQPVQLLDILLVILVI